MKRFLSILLVFALLLCNVGVFAEESADTPYFENIQFLASSIKNYRTEYEFSSENTEYRLELSKYSVTKLTLQSTTVYDTERFNAEAQYLDSAGASQSVTVKSGAITYLENIPFGETDVKISIWDKENPDNKTVYTFLVTRPRDTTKTIKANGISISPISRAALPTKYEGNPEGTMLKLSDDGESFLGTGVSATHYSYKCFVFSDVEEFKLSVTGTTAFEHIRYSVDDENLSELPIGGGTTDNIGFNGKAFVTVKIQVLDDEAYTKNKQQGNDGFFGSEPTEYTVIVQNADVTFEGSQIKSASTGGGDWYPCAFSPDRYSYTIVTSGDVTEETLQFTVPEGATVSLGDVQEGVYSLTLTSKRQSVKVTSRDGKTEDTYSFELKQRSAGYPERVVDYLCVNSQYTNGVGFGNAATPWVSLYGSIVSLGNFGGYITYYYDEPIIDNPNSKYGIDFYVYGNASKDTSTSTKTSFFEPAQAWVSEDGENWYALAGSAHYDDGVTWDYSVTYEKTASGKTAWTDSFGNKNDGTSYCGAYPLSAVYNMNTLANSDKMTLSGIALPARNGEIAVFGDVTDSYPVKWGYADCFPNGTKGADVNPYTDNEDFSLSANGFDLSWAVDENGYPIDTSEKEFHYVKLVTASNIWHKGFGEKSPEISGVLKATEGTEPVGKTAAPSSFAVVCGDEIKTVELSDEQRIYDVDAKDAEVVSISVNGASEDDNIYINNTRISYGETEEIGFSALSSERLVRVVVQNGDKEPLIYILRLQRTAHDLTELIKDIKLSEGTATKKETEDGTLYTSSVDSKTDYITISPTVDEGTEILINGEVLSDSYPLKTGENEFEIHAADGKREQTVKLVILRSSAPSSSGTIKVYFTLLGDEIHGEDGSVHTLKKGNLTTWMPKTSITVDSGATVLDVIEKATEGKYAISNPGGNYITEIDGLSEQSNGPLSGWMYTLNGTYPDKGIAEQAVKNGDSIVFHYTDDFMKEFEEEKPISGGPSSPSHVSKPKEEMIEDETPQMQFADVSPDAWYYDCVKYVFEKNLMQGTDKGFEPETNMSRAMLVTILYRIANPEPSNAKSAFSDVAVGSWYEEAVNWAAECGIVSGVSKEEFAPDSDISREQLAAVLYRFAEKYGWDTSNCADISGFSDASDASEWAKDALGWANYMGIISGTSETELSPKKSATRAEVASILMRFCEIKGDIQ